MINKLMRKFFASYIDRIVNATIERCAQVCEMNSVENELFYMKLHDISTHPDTDFGVLKYIACSGQAGRDADEIRRLKNGEE